MIGVFPKTFRFPERAELWLPLRIDPAKAKRTDYFTRGIARLKPGVTIDAASAELESLLEQIHRENAAVNNGGSLAPGLSGSMWPGRIGRQSSRS